MGRFQTLRSRAHWIWEALGSWGWGQGRPPRLWAQQQQERLWIMPPKDRVEPLRPCVLHFWVWRGGHLASRRRHGGRVQGRPTPGRPKGTLSHLIEK